MSRKLSHLPSAGPEPRRTRNHDNVEATEVCSKRDEGKWVQQLIQRDAEAWNTFFSQYGRLIGHRIRRAFEELAHPWRQDVSEEIAAEVVLQLLRDDARILRNFQGKSRFSTWLTTIVRRIALRMILGSSQNGVPPLSVRQVDAAQEIPEALAFDFESAENHKLVSLRYCMKRLGDEDRQILKWYYFDQCPYLEIGRRLGIRENSVGPRLSRARRRLEKLLHQHEKSGAFSSRGDLRRHEGGGR